MSTNPDRIDIDVDVHNKVVGAAINGVSVRALRHVHVENRTNRLPIVHIQLAGAVVHIHRAKAPEPWPWLAEFKRKMVGK